VSRIQVRDGFLVLMAALWCADESGVLPIFLLAAAVHECGHLFVIRLSGGSVHALCLTACGAVLRCSLPPSPFSRAAICLAGPAASFALTALANPLGAYRLAGASALLGLFNLLPVPPLDGGMALRHLADGRFTRLLNGIAGVSVLVLLAGGVLLWKSGFGGWLFLAGLMVAVSFGRAILKKRASIKSLTTGSDCRGCNLMMPLFSIRVPVSSWTTGSNCRSWWLMIPLSPIIL